MTVRQMFLIFNALLWLPLSAKAHVSEQGFVLLLPTDLYNQAGAAAVALTVLALFAVPENVVRGLFAWRSIPVWRPDRAQTMCSFLSFLALCFVVYLGLNGPRNPLANLMSLSFWTLGWIICVSLAGFFGNLWLWLNPWTGLYALLGYPKAILKLPEWLDLWPCCLMLVAFAGFLLADIAPDDPTRLAYFVATYWALTMIGLVVFGPSWLQKCELGHAIFAAYSSLSLVRLHNRAGIGGPGWQTLETQPMKLFGVFALLLLAVGSFDGVNETFWWLGKIGVNPLEFPGRSAVVGVTIFGLLLSIAALFATFAGVVWVGLQIAESDLQFWSVFSALAVSILPIALVYHMAHYMTSFLVNIQYFVAALNDPFAQGWDIFGLDPIRVTTGFFNKIDTVRLIFLTQAGLVVVGHVWSVLLAHRIAVDLFGSGRKASVATLPLSVFMIGYTFLGLWLLAAPKGA